ncbi:MAG TPA: hypothetical protein VFV54_01990 [Thermoanaerobaculia bacterium]|nr:hypothetical protein [Thermoanaerobaculia bacterium]
MTIPKENRRRADRIRLSKPFVCRFGTHGVVLIDISNYGARLEHYSRFDRGTERVLRFRWNRDEIAMPASIVSCRVERFVPGDSGLTVYRSGVRFTQEEGAEFEKVKKMTSAHLATTLVEQVANARGFKPMTKEGEMPIFRNGTLTSNQFDIGVEGEEHLLPERDLARRTGFICYSLARAGWSRKWTLDPRQPEEGFTVSANETWEQVESLCELYRHSDAEGRRFIRVLAEASVEAELKRSETASGLASTK